MKNQAKPGYISNDDVQTPAALCRCLVHHFRPGGTVLEPCRGEGNFFRELIVCPGVAEVLWCEIKEGRDFYQYGGRVDWVLTNPPWSHLSETKAKREGRITFLEKSLQVAGNVVFLITLNHALGLKARYRLLDRYGFGIREVLLLDTPPKPWPQGGFQVGAVHFQRGYSGPAAWTDFRGVERAEV